MTLFTLANGWLKDRAVTYSSQERILIPNNSDEEVLGKVSLIDKMALVRRICLPFESRFRTICLGGSSYCVTTKRKSCEDFQEREPEPRHHGAVDLINPRIALLWTSSFER